MNRLTGYARVFGLLDRDAPNNEPKYMVTVSSSTQHPHTPPRSQFILRAGSIFCPIFISDVHKHTCQTFGIHMGQTTHVQTSKS